MRDFQESRCYLLLSAQQVRVFQTFGALAGTLTYCVCSAALLILQGQKKKNWEIMQQLQSKLIMYHELINYSKLLQIMQFLHTVGHFTFFYQV